MAKLNQGYEALESSYLFSEVGKRRDAFEERTGKPVIRIDIGDAKLPLSPTVARAMSMAADRLGHAEGYANEEVNVSTIKAILNKAGYDRFNGYGSEQGNSLLRETIAQEYGHRGINIQPDEVFVSDGAKPDSANIQSLFSRDEIVAVQDPAYPVYVDTNVIAGRGGEWDKEKKQYTRLVYMPCTKENDFLPDAQTLRDHEAMFNETPGLIYLCSPNNPTGTVTPSSRAKQFVDYANEKGSVIAFDAAYSEFIKNPNLPKSIFEIPGARDCAIEFQSFSKSAGFTGVRLGFTIVPKDVMGGKLNAMWNRRQGTFFNGASNVVQAGGLVSLLHPQAREECEESVKTYMENAEMLRQCVEDKGFRSVTGGVDSPYIWFNTGMDSWKFLDKLLEETGVSCTPGVGFGPSGDGYARLSAFATRENVERAVDSISKNLRM